MEKIKGKCKYCGKEYTLGYMKRHLASCPVRQAKLSAEKGAKNTGYFELEITPKYDRNYWLFIEVRETATLEDIDTFLRDIWLECCGHLSAFDINRISYESMPDDEFGWGNSEDMDHKLKEVLQVGMKFGYEYDFGSSTELSITVTNYRLGQRKKEGLVILSRNNPYQFKCSECGKPAVAICTECAWEDKGFLCEECSKTHKCGEEMLLDVCNSPRMGVCAYCGSDIYPDQFMADTEKQIEPPKK